ncbi:hypothetical protein C8R45DRAFT_1217728 [Mycena sanguinolenta]|nr:hypothetical protein C8R45DRAFT_1217728 [Mycena sanguinolenta]
MRGSRLYLATASSLGSSMVSPAPSGSFGHPAIPRFRAASLPRPAHPFPARGEPGDGSSRERAGRALHGGIMSGWEAMGALAGDGGKISEVLLVDAQVERGASIRAALDMGGFAPSVERAADGFALSVGVCSSRSALVRWDRTGWSGRGRGRGRDVVQISLTRAAVWTQSAGRDDLSTEMREPVPCSAYWTFSAPRVVATAMRGACEIRAHNIHTLGQRFFRYGGCASLGAEEVSEL